MIFFSPPPVLLRSPASVSHCVLRSRGTEAGEGAEQGSRRSLFSKLCLAFFSACTVISSSVRRTGVLAGLFFNNDRVLLPPLPLPVQHRNPFGAEQRSRGGSKGAGLLRAAFSAGGRYKESALQAKHKEHNK